MQSHAAVINGACTENRAASTALKDGPSSSKSIATTNNGNPELEFKKCSLNLSESDKEVVRLVGQHLSSLGLK